MNGDPIAQASRDPVSDSGPILRHRWGPSSRVPLPDSWRVLKTRKDSDSHPPPLPGGGLPVCTGPNFEKEKKKSDFSNFSGSRFFSIASTLRGQSSALAINDAVQSYSQIVSSV